MGCLASVGFKLIPIKEISFRAVTRIHKDLSLLCLVGNCTIHGGFVICRSDGNTASQGGKKGLFVVERRARINPADPNSGETSPKPDFYEPIRSAG